VTKQYKRKEHPLVTDTSLSFDFPAVRGKDVTARFDGGHITSDCGAVLIARADREIGLIDAMTDQIFDKRQASKVRHSATFQYSTLSTTQITFSLLISFLRTTNLICLYD
jgi:hypothetical protein